MFLQSKQQLPLVWAGPVLKEQLQWRQRTGLSSKDLGKDLPPMELHPNPSCSYSSSFSSMHHPYLHWEAKLQRLLVIITQLPSRYPGLNHQIFLALLPSQPELDEEEPPLHPVLPSSPFGFSLVLCPP